MPVTNLTVGIGTITVDGVPLGWLKGDVTYNISYPTADYATGNPLQVKAKVITEYPKATLKANMAELTNILPFLPPSDTYEMPTHEVVFKTYNRVGRTQITITFPKAVLTSAGIKIAETGYTMTDINIEAVGVVPTVTTEVVGTPPTTYSVTYNPNGGTGGPADSATYTSGQTVTVKFTSLPTRSGYSFQGWATTSGGSAAYTSGGTTTFSISGNTTLYAVWAAVPALNLTYNPNGGTGGPGGPFAYTSGQTVTVKFTPEPFREGRPFLGWSFVGGATSPQFYVGGTTTFTISGNTTLYAIYA